MPPTLSAEQLNQFTARIIAIAIKIHQALGPGLLESAYLACLCYELKMAGLQIEKSKRVPLVYGQVTIKTAYYADLIVEGSVILEVKAVDQLAPIHTRQLHTYLRLADCRVGLLLNFGAATMKAGIKRLVHRFPEG